MKWGRVLVGAVALALVGAVVWVGLGRRPAGTVPENVEVMRDIVYATIGERDLHMDIVRPRELPPAPLPVLVYIHGGAWREGSYHTDLLYPFAQKGYLTASVEYRFTQEAIFPAQIHDCKAAIRFLRARASEYNLDPDRIAVVGISAGGHLAALLGTSGGVAELEGDLGNAHYSSRVQAVIDIFGPTDITTMIPDRGYRLAAVSPEDELVGGPVEEHMDLARQASPLTYVDKTDPPFLIVHGDEDKVVSIAQSEKLDKALREAGVESKFIRVRNAGHGFGLFTWPTLPQVRAGLFRFLDRRLKQQPDSS